MSKTHNHINYVELPASSIDDLNKSKAFFSGAFGWSYQQWGDDYVDTQDSGVGSGISADNPPNATLVVIYVSDIESARSKVENEGGTITKEIFDFPGGKRFHFKDPAGNELAAWSEQ
ncbi:MAG: VOC family protein [Candidatus Moraniibacteriota bacterium]|nr:MAG: VOC family protein [Candidatus Moranbacteria bacterium]